MAQVKIREMPEDNRPREKMLAHGVSALTDAEVLAVLLRTGRVGANAVEVAAELLQRFGSLVGLSRCTLDELKNTLGVGPAKAMQLVATFNVGHRVAHQTFSQLKIDTPELVYEMLAPEMRGLHKESLRVLLLDTRYRLLRVEQISLGSLNESIAHPRDVFRPAIISAAHAVVVVHNHPSGDPSPSQADHALTRRLAAAAELLQLKLLDHIIIGAPAEGRLPYYSFKETGVL